MAQRSIYAVHDLVAQAIVSGVFVYPHDNVAARMFGDLMQMPNTNVNLHPADHVLLCLGELSETADGARVETYGYPRIVISGRELAQQLQAQRAAEEAAAKENRS